MSRQSWRKKVRIIKPSGRVVQNTREYGLFLLESGLAELVREEKRFTVRLIDNSNFKEELRYSSGRPAETIPNPAKLGTFLPTGQQRCRPPRTKLSKEEKDFSRYKQEYRLPSEEAEKQTASLGSGTIRM